MNSFNQGNGFLRRMTYVKEEAMPPSHMPFMLSGEWVVATQQDIRRTETTRQYSYSKIGPNGALIPMRPTQQQSNYVELSSPYQSFGQGQMGMNTSQLVAFLARFRQTQSQEEPVGAARSNDTIENLPAQIKSSLDGPSTASCNQLRAEPMFISRGTMTFSDEERDEDEKNGKDYIDSDEESYTDLDDEEKVEDTDNGKRLSAMEQLKIRKMKQHSFI